MKWILNIRIILVFDNGKSKERITDKTTAAIIDNSLYWIV